MAVQWSYNKATVCCQEPFILKGKQPASPGKCQSKEGGLVWWTSVSIALTWGLDQMLSLNNEVSELRRQFLMKDGERKSL